MTEFSNIRHALRTLFNVEDGLSEDDSIQIYKRMVFNGDNLEIMKLELQEAFSNPSVSWKSLLLNDEYEVFDAESEVSAREYARKILWNPIFDDRSK